MAAATDVDEHYTIISADCHAGGSHAAYREYLDPAFLEDFDAWRNKYKNPYKDLGDNRRLRNWDNEMRNSQQEADGIVGEVVFPNTVPPFFPSFVLFAKPPTAEEYPHRHAGVQAHNRWLVDWCNEFPERRAGVGQIFLNDIDDAIADIHWIKDHGLRGGIHVTSGASVGRRIPPRSPCSLIQRTSSIASSMSLRKICPIPARRSGNSPHQSTSQRLCARIPARRCS